MSKERVKKRARPEIGTGAVRVVQASVLPSDTSASRKLAMGCNRRDFGPYSLELWSVTGPFQPLRAWAAHY
jgi:hypothetical protein